MTALTLAFLTGQLLAGAVNVGVAVDEPTHLDRFEQWLDTGWYVPERNLVDGAPDPGTARSTPFVYGAAFSATAHAVNVAMGNETWGQVSRSRESYAVRHLVIAVLAVAAAGAVGLAVRATTRSRLAGLWSTTALLAIPAWTGHAMFNVKDIPAAAGYTLLTAGLIMSLTRSNAAISSPLRQLDVAALAACAFYFGVGTRPAMWVPLTLSLLSFSVLSALARRDRRLLAHSLAAPLVGSMAGLLSVLALHPNIATMPVRWLIDTVADSSEYAWSGYTLTAGRLLSERPPVWYWTAWLGGSIPVLLLVAAMLGTAIVSGRVLRQQGGWAVGRGLSDARRAAPLLALQQAMLLPVAVMITQSVLYTGLRQHLYILPALAMLAGTGVALVLRMASTARKGDASRRQKGGAIAIIAMLAVSLVKPAMEQTALYPYNYVYINFVGGMGGINDRWETDYWGVSNREALQRVPEGAELRCSSWLVRPWERERAAGIGGCSERHSPFREEIGRNAGAATDDYVWVVARKRAGNLAPDHCTTENSVTRRLRGEDVVIGFLLTCDADAMD